MSAIASSNFFAALSEGTEESYHVPVVKTNNKSTKKEDSNPKADASKARPKKRDPNANNAAFKDKNAGREANKKVPVNAEASSNRRPKSGARDDRRNKTGKKDTQKRENSGWGDNKKELDEEQAGVTIAKADEAAEAAEESEEEQVDNSQTLEEFLAAKQAPGINVARAARKPNEGSDNQQWASAAEIKRPELASSAPRNQGRQRGARKETTVLEPSNEHLPSMRPRSFERGERGDRSSGSQRGPRRGGEKKGAKKPKGPNFDAASLPRLG